jgi:APA family basic amino acid/polyamine antiporter
MAVATTAPETQALPPRLGWFDATTLIVGSMIGSGIFIAPSIMAEWLQTPGLLIGLWIFGGFFTICGALSCAELAAMAPKAGGQYVFLREAWGPLWGFLYGWTLFLVIQTGFNAAVSIAFAKYLGVFIPTLSEANVLLSVPFGSMPSMERLSTSVVGMMASLDASAALGTAAVVNLPDYRMPWRLDINSAQLVACGVIGVLTFINMRGVREGAFVQNLFTILKVGALGAIIAVGLRHLGANAAHFQPVVEPVLGPAAAAQQVGLFAALAVVLSKALFAYDAWNTATFVAEEVRAPERNVPRALLLGTLAVTLVYVLTNVAYLSVLTIQEMAAVPENRVAQEVATRLFGDTGRTLVVVAILISCFGCVNGLILSGARVLFAMAREGLFFQPCATLHARTSVPVVALLYQGVWSCVLTLTGSYDALLTYISFASVLFGALMVAGVYRLRRTQPERARPYRCWGYPVTPALYLLIALPFLIYLVQGDPVSTGYGILLVASGVPVYFWLVRARIA